MELATVEKIIREHGAEKSALIAMLQDVQHEFSYLPQDVLIHLSRTLEVPLSRVYSLATFYRAFSLKPKGRHPIAVCMGTACHVRGAGKILEKFERRLSMKVGQTTPNLMFSLEEVRCVGCCGLAPVVMVGEEVHGKVFLNKVEQIIKRYEKERGEDAKT